MLAEVAGQKAWILAQFATLCVEAGISDPHSMARSLMLLYEGAIVTVGMGTFAEPFVVARALASQLLQHASTTTPQPT